MRILASISERFQFEKGCVSSRVYRSVEEMPAILIEELWMSHEDLQRHLRSARYREILLIVEMASETPEIRFDVISQSGGMETIAQARTLID